MNFKKYDLYGYKDENFKNLLMKKSELNKKLDYSTYVIRDANRKIVDEIEILSNEYDSKLRNYSLKSRRVDKDVEKEMKSIEKDMVKFKINFEKTIIDTFFYDVSKELNIEKDIVETIIEVSLNRMSMYLDMFHIETENDYYGDSDIHVCGDFDDFINDKTLSPEMAEKLFKIVKNELLLLKIKL